MYDYRDLYKDEIKKANTIKNLNIGIAALSNMAACGYILENPEPLNLAIIVPALICTGVNIHFIKKENSELKRIDNVVEVIEKEVYGEDRELHKKELRKRFKVIK